MIERKVTVDQIEITSTNSVQIRLTMKLVEGDQELSSQYHRFMITPELPLATLVELVNGDLTNQGWPPVTPEDTARIGAFEELARTYD